MAPCFRSTCYIIKYIHISIKHFLIFVELLPSGKPHRWCNGVKWWCNGVKRCCNGVKWWCNGVKWWCNGVKWWCNGIKPKTIKLVFVASLLSMQHTGERAKTCCLLITIKCPTGVTCLFTNCCFSELALEKSN